MATLLYWAFTIVLVQVIAAKMNKPVRMFFIRIFKSEGEAIFIRIKFIDYQIHVYGFNNQKRPLM